MQSVRLEKVAENELALFREMVEEYWQELMPRAIVVRDPARRETYFQERFVWDDGHSHPRWAVAEDDRRVGFLMLEVSAERNVAYVHDFYVVPGARRMKYGTAMVQRLLSHLDEIGVEQIDLNFTFR